MSRQFKSIRLNRVACAGLREAVRPLHYTESRAFCAALYLAYYQLESDADLEAVDLAMTEAGVFLINHCVSMNDGDWAADVLHQTRQAFFEVMTDREAVRLATKEDINRLFEETTFNEPEDKDGEQECVKT